MSFRRVTLVAAAVAMTACVHTNATLISNKTYPSVDPSNVVIYTSADRVPGKYEEVAILESKGDDETTDEHRMLESMRKKAAKLGANGVILGQESQPGTVATIAHALIGTSADRKGKSVAIYLPPSAPAATTSAAGAGSQR